MHQPENQVVGVVLATHAIHMQFDLTRLPAFVGCHFKCYVLTVIKPITTNCCVLSLWNLGGSGAPFLDIHNQTSNLKFQNN